MTNRPAVIVLTGAAPYLGGPATWLPLKAQLTDMDVIEIDTLDLAKFDDYEEALFTMLGQVKNAAAIIAHFTAAKPVVRYVDRMHLSTPVILLSPWIVTSDSGTLAQYVIKALLNVPFFRGLLNNFASKKLRKLKIDRQRVRRQLQFFVSDTAISDSLVDEAEARLADVRMVRISEHTSDVLRYSFSPISHDLLGRTNVVVIVGNGALDRKVAARMPVTVLSEVTSAAMLEAPEAVAQIVKSLLDVPY